MGYSVKDRWAVWGGQKSKGSSNQKAMTACRPGWVSWEREQKWTNVSWLYVSWPELLEVMEPREMFIFQIQVNKRMMTLLAKTEGKLSSDWRDVKLKDVLHSRQPWVIAKKISVGINVGVDSRKRDAYGDRLGRICREFRGKATGEPGVWVPGNAGDVKKACYYLGGESVGSLLKNHY